MNVSDYSSFAGGGGGGGDTARSEANPSITNTFGSKDGNVSLFGLVMVGAGVVTIGLVALVWVMGSLANKREKGG